MSKQSNPTVATMGIDIGKNSFHVVGLDRRGAIVLRQKWSRDQVEARLAAMPPCLIGMEACVGAHHLSRKLQAHGHDARLMPAKYVRACPNCIPDRAHALECHFVMARRREGWWAQHGSRSWSPASIAWRAASATCRTVQRVIWEYRKSTALHGGGLSRPVRWHSVSSCRFSAHP